MISLVRPGDLFELGLEGHVPELEAGHYIGESAAVQFAFCATFGLRVRWGLGFECGAILDLSDDQNRALRTARGSASSLVEVQGFGMHDKLGLGAPDFTGPT